MPADVKSKERLIAAVRHTYNAMLDGGTFTLLVNNLVDDVYELGFNYSKPGAVKVIKKAREILIEDFKRDLPEIKERLLAQYYDLYTESKQVGQYQASIKCLENIAKLVGANAPEEKKVTLENLTIDFGFNEDEG